MRPPRMCVGTLVAGSEAWGVVHISLLVVSQQLLERERYLVEVFRHDCSRLVDAKMMCTVCRFP